MHATVKRPTEITTDLIRRFPWAGWAGWFIFCAIALARVTPRRFASTFGYGGALLIWCWRAIKVIGAAAR